MKLLHNEQDASASIYDLKPLDTSETSANVSSSADRSDGNIIGVRTAIKETARKHRRLSSISVAAMCVVSLVLAVGLQILIRQHESDAEFWKTQFPVLTILNLVALLGAAFGLLRNHSLTSRKVREHAKTLAGDTCPESVSSWIDVFKFDGLESHILAKEKLTELLPSLHANDGHLLSANHRALLNRWLRRPPEELGFKDVRELFRNTTKRETAFRIAILEAYKQVGGADALSVVESLANSNGNTEAQKQIQAAAQDCLPYLRFNIEKHSAHKTLLLGSSAGGDSADSLLRAASEVSTTCGADLLRASDPN